MENSSMAVVAIVVEDTTVVEKLNAVLHAYSDNIIGRMGIPYRKKGISLISVMIDAPKERISSLEDELKAIAGLTVKTAYSKD